MIKKIIVIAIILVFDNVHVLSQNKPLIDTGMLDSWPQISVSKNSIALTKDGHYIAYIIHGQPAGKKTLVIKDLRGNWEKTIVASSARLLFFTADSRKLCWRQGDTIWLQQTGNDQRQLLGIAREISYPSNENVAWIAISEQQNAYKLINLINGQKQSFTSVRSLIWHTGNRKLFLTTSDQKLILLDLVNGKDRSFSGVRDYIVSPDEKTIILLIDKDNRRLLQRIDVGIGEAVTIWIGGTDQELSGFVFDRASEQLAFSVHSSDGIVAIWCYKVGDSATLMQIDDKAANFANRLKISGVKWFSANGRWLFISTRKEVSIFSDEKVTTPVDIWSYRDEILNPLQSDRRPFREYTAILEVSGVKTELLMLDDDEREVGNSGDCFLLEKGGNRIQSDINWWPHTESVSYWLVSMKTGKRKLIKKTGIGDSRVNCFYSPEGHWILYWDPKIRHFVSIDAVSGTSVTLTEKLPVTFDDAVEQLSYSVPVGVAGWCVGDQAIFVYDNYDIWKLDPSGKRDAINITGGYGKQNGVKLRLVNGYRENFRTHEKLLLSGYDVIRKFNGFFTIRLDRPGSIEKLTMGPYNYFQETIKKQSFNNSLKPLSGGKQNNKVWVVMRQSASEYPNFYRSKDLKQFTPITNLQPQKAYNWLTAEAVSWRMYNGQMNTGVLYKPENFDSLKKYPLIFNYYEKFSQRCFQFPSPELTSNNINIPWFVSRGYLVFTPDIHYTVASQPGGMTTREAAYNAVASAAEYLALRPFVDKNRMAIQGHSFGGGETVGVITQTGMFAAAAEMAGTVDPISSYLTLITGDEGNGATQKYHKQDHSQARMRVTPWERPDLYFRNSPVLNADKVKTPLLITHNKSDGAINFQQGLEMYLALRRLSKPCWLLQYDNSGHVLSNRNDALDYTIRLTQYFDHYLKGAPAPQWMTGNTLAPYKGRNNLYTLDPAGNCMKDCKVCAEWNAKEKITAK